MASSSPATLLKLEPPPWTCKCIAYVCTFWRSPSQALPDEIYDPLEANSPAFNSADEKYLGGLCLVQIIRYTSTPVGPYDELAILPGFFRQKDKREKYARISRIYVSQKDTCYNGRKNWNIPKHVARFEFTGLAGSAEQQRLLPGNEPEQQSAFRVDVFRDNPSTERPFFSATLTPVRIPLPYIPFSSTWLTTLGINPPLLQPPLPQGGSPEECGTRSWKRSVAKLSGHKSSAMWCDISLPREGERGRAFLPADAGKWWAKWMIALKMEDAILEIGEPEVLERSAEDHRCIGGS
jgi:hypothetical protein